MMHIHYVTYQTHMMVVIIVIITVHQSLVDQYQTMVIFAMIIALQIHLTQIAPLLQEIIVRRN
jgi:hypothetical protein